MSKPGGLDLILNGQSPTCIVAHLSSNSLDDR
jgi:hypothetical protein